jgi:MarR family transcriptional regulator, 2-MHQ and catechol-resistance regulon repressor
MPNNSSHSSKLISLMFVIGRKMRDEMKPTMAKNGCSWIHFEALRYVNDHGKPLMRDVAAHFSITPPAATLLIDGLVANKMLRRIIDTKDRRAVRIALTPKGKQVLTRGIHDRMKKIKELFSVLNAEEHAELVRMLEKIAAAK